MAPSNCGRGPAAIAASLGMLLAAACAPSREAVRTQYQQAVSCCASVAELGYEKLAASDERSFVLGEGSRAFEFETGKSFFRAFELPRGGPYTVVLSSYVVGDGPSTWYVLYPVVLTLGPGYRPLRVLDPGAFHWDTASVFETSGWRKKLEAKFEAGGPDERYLVVLTTAELLRSATSVEMLNTAGGIVAGIPLLVPLGTEQVAVPNAPGGKLRLRIGAQ